MEEVNAPKIAVTEEMNEEIRRYLLEKFPGCGYLLLGYEPETGFVHSFTNIGTLRAVSYVCKIYLNDRYAEEQAQAKETHEPV